MPRRERLLKEKLSPEVLEQMERNDREIAMPHVTLKQLGRFISVAEAARYHKISLTTMRKRIKEGMKL